MEQQVEVAIGRASVADAVARVAAADQLILANRFCRCTTESWRGYRGFATWGPDNLSFTIEGGDEQLARWIGYGVAGEFNELRVDNEDGEPLRAVWHGTVKTPRGTWSAQFSLVADDL